MAFSFRKSTCVVAGTFNMYIVQPAWLTRLEIIPKGIEVAIGTHLDEPGFRFFSPKMPFRWIVRPQKIEVESEAPDADCGGKVAAVLEALPWTPLVALENNTIYRAPLGDLDGLRAEYRMPPEVPAEYSLAQRSVHFGVTREGSVTNLQLSITPEELELSVNVHTELRKLKSEEAQATARRFLQDRREAESLIQKLFDVRIEYVDPHQD